MEDLSLHILDIVENSIRAGATKIEIKIVENVKADLLTIEINDNGRGMNEETVRKALDPFFTTKSKKKVGLGLSLLAHAARESEGDIKIESEVDKGTSVMATFGYSHIDRKPIGNMEKTLKTLITGNTEVDFIYEHKSDESVVRFDTGDLRSSYNKELI